MRNVRIIAVGNIKENYLRDACKEYEKRLGGFCRIEICELREARLPEDPSPGEIAAALSEEADNILANVPPRAYVVALCVEGREYSSVELAQKLDATAQTHSSLCFIIGSSYGLDERVKRAADLRLSLSQLTFPHRLFRVMLLETVYRSMTIISGKKYHK